MRGPRYALRACRRVLCRGWLFLIGETYPSGFGLWETKGVLPIATYPDGLRGWDLVVDHFLRLGDRPYRRRCSVIATAVASRADHHRSTRSSPAITHWPSL